MTDFEYELKSTGPRSSARPASTSARVCRSVNTECFTSDLVFVSVKKIDSLEGSWTSSHDIKNYKQKCRYHKGERASEACLGYWLEEWSALNWVSHKAARQRADADGHGRQAGNGRAPRRQRSQNSSYELTSLQKQRSSFLWKKEEVKSQHNLQQLSRCWH